MDVEVILALERERENGDINSIIYGTAAGCRCCSLKTSSCNLLNESRHTSPRAERYG